MGHQWSKGEKHKNPEMARATRRTTDSLDATAAAVENPTQLGELNESLAKYGLTVEEAARQKLQELLRSDMENSAEELPVPIPTGMVLRPRRMSKKFYTGVNPRKSPSSATKRKKANRKVGRGKRKRETKWTLRSRSKRSYAETMEEGPLYTCTRLGARGGNLDEEDEEFDVEMILDVRMVASRGQREQKREMLIRWKGFDSEYDEWIDEEMLSCPVEEYSQSEVAKEKLGTAIDA